jgi:hypothetical protein
MTIKSAHQRDQAHDGVRGADAVVGVELQRGVVLQVVPPVVFGLGGAEREGKELVGKRTTTTTTTASLLFV